MNSKQRQECYVYITLPGHIEPVTAGRYVLTTNRQGITARLGYDLW